MAPYEQYFYVKPSDITITLWKNDSEVSITKGAISNDFALYEYVGNTLGEAEIRADGYFSQSVTPSDYDPPYITLVPSVQYVSTVTHNNETYTLKDSNAQTVANLVTSVSSSSTDTQYPSAKLFYDTCGDIETLINAL